MKSIAPREENSSDKERSISRIINIPEYRVTLIAEREESLPKDICEVIKMTYDMFRKAQYGAEGSLRSTRNILQNMGFIKELYRVYRKKD